MNKYSELTDEEIERLVELTINPNSSLMYIPRFCNSWSDTGPLIEKYKIDIAWEFSGLRYLWRVDGMAEHLPVFAENNDNILRAICECILLINDRSE